MKMRWTRGIVVMTIGAAMATGVEARAATLAADYQLQGIYDSSVGTIGPLTVAGNSGDVTFATDQDVDGNTQTVASLDINYNGADTGAGLQAQTAGFLSSSDYSVVLLAEFNLDADLVATKVFDFDDLSSDAGLYINDATGLLYFNGAVGATGPLAATTGSYTQIVLTRASSDLVTVYENGAEDFQFADTGGLAVLGPGTGPSGDADLTTFKDDGTGVGSTLVNETSVGDIARLRLYDGALTPDEVAALDTVVPEPLSSGVLLLGGGLMMMRRLRRRG